MVLDAQGKAIVDAMDQAGLLPLRSLGVEGLRHMTDGEGASDRGPTPGSVEDITISGSPDIRVRLYRPAVSESSLPLCVYFHGGGWVMGGIESHDQSCRQLALDGDCLVASVAYRLAPEHPFPAAVDDAWAATEWLMDHANELGADGERVAIAGDSSGGNLAAVVCRLARDVGRTLVLQLLIYPVVDRRCNRPSMSENESGYLLERADMEWFWTLYDPEGVAATDPRAALTVVTDLSGLPPTLVITAEHDPLRDEGEEYGALLGDAGVAVTVRRYRGAFHGFFTMGGALDCATDAHNEAVAALRAAFGIR